MYAPTEYLSKRLITKGHCNNCGFDDYLLSFSRLTDDQEIRRFELQYASDYQGSIDYDLELIAGGFMDYTAFPPPVEV